MGSVTALCGMRSDSRILTNAGKQQRITAKKFHEEIAKNTIDTAFC
jgi:hypothetical protein